MGTVFTGDRSAGEGGGPEETRAETTPLYSVEHLDTISGHLRLLMAAGAQSGEVLNIPDIRDVLEQALLVPLGLQLVTEGATDPLSLWADKLSSPVLIGESMPVGNAIAAVIMTHEIDDVADDAKVHRDRRSPMLDRIRQVKEAHSVQCIRGNLYPPINPFRELLEIIEPTTTAVNLDDAAEDEQLEETAEIRESYPLSARLEKRLFASVPEVGYGPTHLYMVEMTRMIACGMALTTNQYLGLQGLEGGRAVAVGRHAQEEITRDLVDLTTNFPGVTDSAVSEFYQSRFNSGRLPLELLIMPGSSLQGIFRGFEQRTLAPGEVKFIRAMDILLGSMTFLNNFDAEKRDKNYRDFLSGSATPKEYVDLMTAAWQDIAQVIQDSFGENGRVAPGHWISNRLAQFLIAHQVMVMGIGSHGYVHFPAELRHAVPAQNTEFAQGIFKRGWINEKSYSDFMMQQLLPRLVELKLLATNRPSQAV